MSYEICNIKELIHSCSGLLIAAGAGMGVDSGLPDFRGKEGFWRAYPPLQKLGIRFEEMANPRWFTENPELAWGFYGHRYNLYQSTNPHEGYRILNNWVEQFRIPSFIFTSNVDGHFGKAGWDQEILECHGSLMRLQCLENCGQPVWNFSDSKDHTFEICSDSLTCLSPLPKCPRCECLARPNILMFSDFYWDDSIHSIQEKQLDQWLQKHGTENLLLMEFGAGLDVPTVRYFCEHTWKEFNCNMIRVNPRDSKSPTGIISLPIGALEAINKIEEAM